MAKITYPDKQQAVDILNPQPNEVFTPADANMVKSVVNAVDDALALKADLSQVTNAQSQGAWNAATNTPTLSATPLAVGKFYEVSVAGTSTIPTGASVAYNAGDKLLSNGTVWQVVPFTAAKIAAWSAIAFPLAAQVNYLGKDWVANAATLSIDVPGISTKWEDRLTGIYPAINLNNPVLDAEFLKQAVGYVPNTPWTVFWGGAINFQAASRVINTQTPIGNTAVEVDIVKRSSDSKNSDFQIYQKVLIPLKHRDRATWAMSFYIKKEASEISINTPTITYYSDDAMVTALAQTTTTTPIMTGEIIGQWFLVKIKNIPLPAGSKGVEIRIRANWNSGITTPLDIIRKLHITGVTAIFDGSNPEGYIKNQDENIKSIATSVIPVLPPLLTYTDIEELNNNPVKDSLLLKQTIGGVISAPYTVAYGGASRYQGAHRIVSLVAPYSNVVIEIDNNKRSSDGFATDNQFYQVIVIPKHLQGKLIWSFGAWVKRESSAVSIVAAPQTYYSDEAGTVQIGSSTPTVLMTGEVVGNWVFMQLNNMTLTAGAKAVKIGFRTQANTAVIASDTVVKCWFATPVANFASGTILGYTKNTDEKIVELSADASGVFTRLKNKKWCSFGDSITAANTYQGPVITRYTLTHYLRGIGSSRVVQDTLIAWVDAAGNYLDRPPSVQPIGSFEITTNMSSQQRIDTIPLDTEIITIAAGANDNNGTVGLITDIGVTTFYGAYQTMLDRIYVRIPNAEVILVTPIHIAGETDNMEQHREAIRAIAKKYKYALIDMAKCGINQLNQAVFLADGVHPNAVGYERMSRLLLSHFITIYA